MKKVPLLIFLVSILVTPLTDSSGAELPKVAVWDSSSGDICNRSLKMLEDSFAKKEIPRTECNTKEIDNNIKLAQDLGIQGTPTVVFADGRVHAGSMSAKQFVDLLQEKK